MWSHGVIHLLSVQMTFLGETAHLCWNGTCAVLRGCRRLNGASGRCSCSAGCDSKGHSCHGSQGNQREMPSGSITPIQSSLSSCTVPLRRSSMWQTHRWQDMWSVLCHSQLTGTPLKLCPPPFQGHEQTGMAATHQGQQQDTEGRISVCSVGLAGDPTGGVYIPCTNLCSMHLPLRTQPSMCSWCSVLLLPKEPSGRQLELCHFL